MAPTAMIQNGTDAVLTISPVDKVLTIAANGPMALATSFAPWANDKSAAAKISGIVNRLLTDRRRFSIPTAARFTEYRTTQ